MFIVSRVVESMPESQGVRGFWVELKSDSYQQEDSESDFFVRLRLQKSNRIIFTSHSYVGNSCWNGTISCETFIETEDSCCAQWFPLIASCYKIVDSQTSLMLRLSRSLELFFFTVIFWSFFCWDMLVTETFWSFVSQLH